VGRFGTEGRLLRKEGTLEGIIPLQLDFTQNLDLDFPRLGLWVIPLTDSLEGRNLIIPFGTPKFLGQILRVYGKETYFLEAFPALLPNLERGSVL